MEFEKCREILLREHEVVAQAAALQKLIEKAVHKREWTDFDAHLNALNSYSSALAEMEKEREALFSAHTGSPPNSEALNQGESACMPVQLAGGILAVFTHCACVLTLPSAVN
jgi:hypothetical protein